MCYFHHNKFYKHTRRVKVSLFSKESIVVFTNMAYLLFELKSAKTRECTEKLSSNSSVLFSLYTYLSTFFSRATDGRGNNQFSRHVNYLLRLLDLEKCIFFLYDSSSRQLIQFGATIMVISFHIDS